MNIVAANSKPCVAADASSQSNAVSAAPECKEGASFANAMQAQGCAVDQDAGQAANTEREQGANAEKDSGPVEKDAKKIAHKDAGKEKADAHRGKSQGATNGVAMAAGVGDSEAAAPVAVIPNAAQPIAQVNANAGEADSQRADVAAGSQIAAVSGMAAKDNGKAHTQKGSDAGQGVVAGSVEKAEDVASHSVAAQTTMDAGGTQSSEATGGSGAERASAVPAMLSATPSPAAMLGERKEAAACATGTIAEPVHKHELTMSSFEAAGPNRLEVGLNGGSLGWLSVRAEIRGDSAIHAMLRGPAETTGALKAQASELEGFLQAHSVSVARISIESVRAVPVAQSFQFADSGGSGGNGAPMGQGSSAGQEKRQQAGEVVWSAEPASVEGGETAISVPLFAAMQSGMPVASTGSWLSVRV